MKRETAADIREWLRQILCTGTHATLTQREHDLALALVDRLVNEVHLRRLTGGK